MEDVAEHAAVDGLVVVGIGFLNAFDVVVVEQQLASQIAIDEGGEDAVPGHLHQAFHHLGCLLES